MKGKINFVDMIFIGFIVAVLALGFGATNGVGEPNPAVNAAVSQYWSNSPIGVIIAVCIAGFVVISLASTNDDDDEEGRGRRR